ncbi:glycosyltransferase [Lutibacter maritimus]|uniref:Glycosyltransferase like family protein n=1 Tax=Lutibacter maritimus TaxID=593133 RepID=A0A1I6SNP8_9FLAO|nr:glycosyltransferase [Lutibacter maritimus]SFS78583.1 Glycosyltransferase like family protein [Lutibacter maritimus]
MLSIIICSRTKEIKNELFENIKSTIGCDYELIIIDNSNNLYSIFEAYNYGIKKSKRDICCFMHDDILIHTANWGILVESIFKNNSELGLLGVAGAKVKSKMPSAWWDCDSVDKMGNIIQHFPDGRVKRLNYGFIDNVLQEAVVIDGIFMVMRKIDGLQFSESLKGYHNYDLNISIEVIKRNYKIKITNEILIEHFSLGNLNSEWVISSYNLYKTYENFLPLKLYNTTYNKSLEVKNAKKFINLCFQYNQVKLIKEFWYKLFLLNPFIKTHFKYLLKYINLKFF